MIDVADIISRAEEYTRNMINAGLIDSKHKFKGYFTSYIAYTFCQTRREAYNYEIVCSIGCNFMLSYMVDQMYMQVHETDIITLGC